VSGLPDFRLEMYFSRREFKARFHLTASDAESMPLAGLLAMADDEDRREWDELRLGYNETWDNPGLRVAIAETYERVAPEDVLCFAGTEEAVYLATNLPVLDVFFDEHADLFAWERPDGGCVCFPRYLGADGVKAFCTALVEEAGVLLLPASIFRSGLTPTPTDRFRVGVGRAKTTPALEAFAAWLKRRAA